LAICLINWEALHESIWGSENIDPCSLDLGTSWTLQV
jgi:hypothetical protein